MASFPTARQSGDLRAGRQADCSAEACRLTCAPAARQGPIAAATGPRWQAPEHQQAPYQLQPLERPQGTAEAWWTSTAQPSGPISPLQCLGGRQPGWQVPFGFRIPGAWKSTRKPTSRPDHTWAGAEAVGWGYPRRESPDIPAGTPRVNQKRCKNMPFLHHQGPVAPSIDRYEAYGLHDVVCAWERSLLQAAQEDLISEWQKIPETVVRAAIWDFTEGWLPLCRLAAATLISYLICC